MEEWFEGLMEQNDKTLWMTSFFYKLSSIFESILQQSNTPFIRFKK